MNDISVQEQCRERDVHRFEEHICSLLWLLSDKK